VCVEHDPEVFALVRRHAVELDRWFTQRLGYRLHVGGDTARLYKSGYVPDDRPLRTATGRSFHRGDYVMLALVLASVIAGPVVISLRDLVRRVRAAAADAGVALPGESAERRALVTAVQWMVSAGVAAEVFDRVDSYVGDEHADALLRVRPDRVNLLLTTHLAPAVDARDLLDRADRRENRRAWMRARLVEDPVVYREDLTDEEWAELRRRLGEEERFLDEMFGLELEARAEGIAALDPLGGLSDATFPAGGTVDHAALLVAAELSDRAASGDRNVTRAQVAEVVGGLIEVHGRRWEQKLVASPEALLRRVLALLAHVRLIEVDGDVVEVRPAAARYALAGAPGTGQDQTTLW
jgi:uncharacterized protein (TIGR02678 family)